MRLPARLAFPPLLGAVLHSTATRPGGRFTDARKMLNWGFRVRAASAALAGRLDSFGL